MKTRHYGFTLIELVITLSIILLITGLTIPGFTHLHRSIEARQDRTKIIDALSLARITAISKGQTISLCFSNNRHQCDRYAGHYLLVFDDNNRNTLVDSGELLYLFTFSDLEARLALNVSGGRRMIRFKADGTVSEFGNINYCPGHGDAHFATRIVVNIGGRAILARDSNLNGVVEDNRGKDIRC